MTSGYQKKPENWGWEDTSKWGNWKDQSGRPDDKTKKRNAKIEEQENKGRCYGDHGGQRQRVET